VNNNLASKERRIFQGGRGKNISSTIMFEVILMGESMIDVIPLFLVWDSQKKIHKGDDTTL